MEELTRDDRAARIRDLERGLEEAERRLEETQSLTMVGSWEWPLPDGPATWSKELLRIYERDADGSPPSMDKLLASVHPDDRQGVARLLERMRTQCGDFEHCYRIVDGRGETHYLRGRGHTVAGADGNPTRAYGTTQDISATERSELRLQQTQALARVGSWEWLITQDDEWQSTWSAEMQRIFGRHPDGPPPTRDELIEYVHPADRPAFQRLVARVRSTVGPFDHTYRIVGAGGQIRHMQARGYVEGDADGRPIRAHGTTQDITELKESQAQLERARRLEAVGQLAGGVAHDFNNLLPVILNYAEYMAEADQDPETIDGLREIERAALSGADLTRRLLLFSRRDSNEPKPVDFAVVVKETEEMLRRTIGDHVELTVAASKGLPMVMLGDGQAEQILVNLVVNARDALPQGGTVAIRAHETDEGERQPGAAVDRAEPSSVVVSVADDGIGMSEEVAAQAFDPFFTTKPRGYGTGLGLATVYGIAGQAGGYAEIESEPDRGTTVSVYLPATSQAQGAEPDSGPAAPPRGDGRTVLVVDNEEAVRTIICHMLRRRGYRTLAAAGGEEAVTILDDAAAGVDLLLTDMLMPGMSGQDLARRVQDRHPGLPTICMSGFAGGETSPLGPWDDGVAILQKPFTAKQLLAAIDDSLPRG